MHEISKSSEDDVTWKQVCRLGVSKKEKEFGMWPYLSSQPYLKDFCHPQAGMEIRDQQRHYIQMC